MPRYSKNYLLSAIFIFLLPVLTSCAKNDFELQLPAPHVKSVPPIQPPEKKKEGPKYSYDLDTQRDPFVPLIGGTGGSASAGETGFIDRRGAFINLELKGIVRNRKGKIAMISTSDGESFFLKTGRVYDKRNRIVNGVSGIIKESSVVLISKNKMTKELSLRKTNDGDSIKTSGSAQMQNEN